MLCIANPMTVDLWNLPLAREVGKPSSDGQARYTVTVTDEVSAAAASTLSASTGSMIVSIAAGFEEVVVVGRENSVEVRGKEWEDSRPVSQLSAVHATKEVVVVAT